MFVEKEFEYHLGCFKMFFEEQLKFDEDYCSVLLQASRLGQHPPIGTGAGVPSGQILTSMVQKTLVQSVIGVVQALNDGQHSPTGTGAGVPSGQILRSMVQKV